jgi:DDE domain
VGSWSITAPSTAGATRPAAARRGGPKVPRPGRSRLASRHDVRSNPRAVALHYRVIDGHGQIVDVYVSPTRDMAAARRYFERAIASSGTTPRRVITDKAATYPPALAAAVPGVLHRTGRYRTNGLERDHGFLKDRLRPMRGLKSVVSAAIFMSGHALMRNIRRGFYRIVESVPERLVFAWNWNRLAGAA